MKALLFLTVAYSIPHSLAVSSSEFPAPKEFVQTAQVRKEWVKTLEDRLEGVLNLVKLKVLMRLQVIG